MGRSLIALGLLLALLAAATIGVGIADVIVTYFKYCSDDKQCPSSNVDLPFFLPLVFTWVASGIWAGIPVFITGILAISLIKNPVGRSPIFFAVAFATAVVFIPAMVVLSALELYFVLDKDMYDVSEDSGERLKFIFPIIVCGIGLIEFFLTAGMIIYMCLSTARHPPSEEPPPGFYETEMDEIQPAKRPPPPSPSKHVDVYHHHNLPPSPYARRQPVFPAGRGYGYYYPNRIYPMPVTYGSRPAPMSYVPMSNRVIHSNTIPTFYAQKKV